MKKLSSLALVLMLVLSALPGTHPGSLRAASAYAPPPPVGPESSSAPATGEGTAGDLSHQAPSPDTIPEEVEQARARQAMESVLDKYLAYWGPRYQVAPVVVTVEGEWAHGVAEWRSQARTLSEPIHVLAHRLPDGTWQALMPSSEGLYLQWVSSRPLNLAPAEQKSRLVTQAEEMEALHSVDAPPLIPAGLRTGDEEAGEPVISGLFPARVTPTPTARSFRAGQNEDGAELGTDPLTSPVPTPVPGPNLASIMAQTQQAYWVEYRDPKLRYGLAVPNHWTVLIAALDGYGASAVLMNYDQTGLRGTEPWPAGAVKIELSAYRVEAGTPLEEWVNRYVAQTSWDPDEQTVIPTVVALEASTLDDMDALRVRVQDEERTNERDTFLAIQLPDAHVLIIRVMPKVAWTLPDVVAVLGSLVTGSAQPVVLPKSVPASLITLQTAPTVLEIHPCDWGNEVGGSPIQPLHMPFSEGTSWMVGGIGYYYGDGTHSGNDYYATDWNRSPNDDCGQAVYPVASGTAYVLSDPDGYGNYVEVYHDAAEVKTRYAHLSVVSIQNGTYVSPNTKIGEVGTTGLSSGCHLHLSFLVKVNGVWNSRKGEGRRPSPMQTTAGSWELCDGQIRTVPNKSSGSCPGPSLQSPADGYISSGQAIDFSWSAPSGCTFEGYTFRIKTTSDMESGGTTIVDTGNSQTWRTETISTQWNNQDLFWGVRTANPLSPNWSVRRFRIEPSSPPSCNPNSDQVALYDDPNRNNNGSCVTLNVGNYPNPGTLGSLGNDVASSVKVGSNVQAVLCRHDNYQDCETFTGDDGNLADNFIGDNAVSSSKVEWRASPPAAPGLQSPANGAQLPQSTNLTFVWSSSSGATEYQAHYEGGPSGAHDSPWMSSTSWNVGTQWCGDYSWRVRARNSAGESAWSGTRTVTIVPNTPGGLSASAASASQINLSWSDPGGEKDGYNVYYSNGTYIGSTSSTSYQVTGLSCNTSFSFYVKAYRNSYLSDASNTASASTQSCPPADTQPPVVNWTAPVGNEQILHVRSQMIQLEASASDNVAVQRVDFYRWDAVNEVWLDIGSDYAAPYQMSFNCGVLNSEWNHVFVAAYDTTGNGSGGKWILLYRDTPAPDLHPYTLDGCSYPVVPASIPGTHQANTLITGQPTYFDWYFANSGDAVASGDFHVELWVGSTRYIRYPFSNWGSGWASGFDDWNETVSTPGWQTVRLTTDPDGTIDEYDEGNNTWQQDFYWAPRAPYADSMEAGMNDWTATGLWHQVDENGDTYGESHSWSHSWWYGQDSTGDYDTGGSNAGDLTSPPIYVPSAGHYLRFWYRYETETMANDWDVRSVQIAVDGGPFADVLQLWDDPMSFWLQSPALDLSGSAGHVIRVRFHFDTGDANFNDYRGWYVDDLEISTTPPPSCADTYEPNNTPAQARSISYGQIFSAEICPNGDYDFYTFTGTAGDKVVVDIDATVDGSLLDSYVFLLDSDGTTVLAEHDDEIPIEVQDSLLGYYLPHDGTYYIKVRAWNHPSVGSPNHFYDIHLLTDNTNPSSAQVTSPASDAWLNPTQQTVDVSATDGESGVNRVEFLWHDADWENSDWVWLGADGDGRDGWTWDMDTSGLPEQRGGAFYVWAFDWVGNWTGAGAWNLGIDRTPPTVTASVQQVHGDAPFIDFWVTWWGAEDNLSDIVSYDVQVRDGATRAWTDLIVNTSDTYTRFVGQDGHTYYFRARARDEAGNAGIYAEGDGDAQHTVQVCPVAADVYEADDGPTTAHGIALDGSWQAHNVHDAGDQDWTRFQAVPGVTYTLVTTPTGEHADTVLFLYEPNGGTLIASDDDGGTGLASRLVWQPAAAGVYYAMVNHWDEWAYGCTTGYDVSISTDDVTAPTGSLRIDGGATYANSSSVTLSLSGADLGTGLAQAIVANSNDFSGATWADYAASLPWALPTGDGTKTVYLKLRDRAGNESEVYTDAIVLDTTAPTGSILIEGGATVVTETQVILTLTGEDANGVAQMRLRNDAEAWGNWEAFVSSRAWMLPARKGEHTVWVEFRDSADNLSTDYSGVVFLDLQAYYAHLPIVVRNR